MKSRNTSKASVVFINRVYPPYKGATGRVLRELAKSMADNGWKVTIVTAAPKSCKQKDGKINIVRVAAPFEERTHASSMIVWWKLLRQAMKIPSHELVVSMTDPPLTVIAGAILAKFKGSAHLHWCHDIYPDLLPVMGIKIPGLAMGLMSFLSSKALKSADRVIVIGRCMARLITSKGVDPRKISLVPNWPDEDLDVATLKSAWYRKKPKKIKGAKPFADLFKDEQPKFRVMYAGNLGLCHPIKTIVDAAEMLAEDYPDIEFVFVGEGRRQEELANERAKRQLHNIRLLPYQPSEKLRAMLESGDIHIVSMNHDAAGLLVPCKMYSSFAVKRPCIFIGPSFCEAAKVINGYKAGAVIQQGQSGLLAETVRRFRDDGKTWFSVRDGAIEAGKVFTPEHSIKAWTERARAVVERRRKM